MHTHIQYIDVVAGARMMICKAHLGASHRIEADREGKIRCVVIYSDRGRRLAGASWLVRWV